MNSVLISFGLFFILLAAPACNGTHDSLEPVDYITWVEDTENGLSVKKQLDKYTFELQYKPHDYIVLKDSDGKISEAEMKKDAGEIAGMQYFTFRISDEKGSDLLRSDIMSVEHFSKRLAYFSCGMQKDIKLVDHNDTLACLLFHFERTFGVDPRSTFILGFPDHKKNGAEASASDKIFLFDDHELGAGPVYITISADKIKQVPFLKLN